MRLEVVDERMGRRWRWGVLSVALKIGQLSAYEVLEDVENGM